jgi:hypothetical protein
MCSVAAVCVFGIAITSCSRPESGQSAATAPAARFSALDRELADIESRARDAPRDRWDPDYVVGALGRDPYRLFAWVQTNTDWIAYHGILRGPVGVLMDGEGNSLDRSLLLATLLEKAGHTVRLAHGALSQEQIVSLLPRLVAHQAASPGSNGEIDTSLAQKVQATATRFLQGSDAGRHALKAQGRSAARLASDLPARVTDQTRRLLLAFDKPDPQEDWNTRFAAAVAALRDHWWVQRLAGGTWVDMDLFDVSAKGSAALAAPSDTLELKGVAEAPLHHEIAVRVIAEQWSGGALSERTALEQVLRPADLIGQSIALQFWPTAPFTDSSAAGQPAAATGNDFQSAALAQHEWAAVLLIGREVSQATLLPDSGDDPDAGSKGGAMGGLAGGFADTFAPSRASTTTSSHDVLSAVWLEYEIRVPGEEPRKIRRTVFDLIGPATRASGIPAMLALDDSMRLARSSALMMRTEILPVVARIAPELVTHLVSQSLLDNRELLKASQSGSSSVLDHAAPTVSSLYALALAQANPDPNLIIIDRPLLLTNHSRPVPGGDGVTVLEATDIVANEVGVSLVARDAFSVRLAQGVRDTNAESLMQGEAVSGNAGDAFANPTTWVTLLSPDEAAVDKLKLSVDIRRRILEDLTAGYTVIAPETTVRTNAGPFAAWWRIDPSTGSALGFGPNGWGQAGTEEGFNSARAGTAGRLFINAARRFVAGFIGTYVWCVAPLIQKHVAAPLIDGHIGIDGARVGFKAAAKESVGECVGDALFVGACVTLPLVILTVNSRGGARVPVPPEAKLPPERANTVPDLGKTQPDLGKTSPDLGKTSPDLGRTSPDLGKTRDLGKTQPYKHTLDLGELPKEPEAPPVNPARVPTKAQLAVEVARKNLADANARRLQAAQESQQPTEEFVKYRAKRPNPGRGWEGDPANWDAVKDKQLEDKMWEKQDARDRAFGEWYKAQKQLKQAEKALKDASAAESQAAGNGGVPPPKH